MVLHIPGGAGFLPSTVSAEKMFINSLIGKGALENKRCSIIL